VIIASHSRFLLRRYLRQHGDRCQTGHYFSLVPLSNELERELFVGGLRPLDLPDFSDQDRETALRQYIDLIGRIGQANADHELWWATDLAAKNRFSSPLAGLLTEFARCQRAAETAVASNAVLVMCTPPWPWLASWRNTRPGTLKVLAWPWHRQWVRCRGKFAAWTGLFRGALSALFAILVTRFTSGLQVKQHIKGMPTFLIKSFVYAGSVRAGRYSDPFFGRLQELVSKPGASLGQALTVVQGTGARSAVYRPLSDLSGQQVLPLEAYLGIGDVLAALVRVSADLLFRRFAVPGNLMLLGADLAPACRELLASGGWRIQFAQLLHFQAARRMVRRHQLRVCALTYEGNAWERMFVKGLRTADVPPIILGFQHSVVPPAAAGVFASQQELSCAPLPDWVLTTGEQPAMILQQFGAIPPTRIQPTGALRYEYLQDSNLMLRRRDSRRILVALEGVERVISLLDYALTEAARCPDLDFNIRAHPVLPVEELLRRLGRRPESVPGNLEFSTRQSVQDDVLDCDAVLYWGSTVAVEAVFIGRPVIHFSAGDLLSYDPLFQLNDFKWTTRRGLDLMKAVSGILSLSDEAYAVQQARARKYVSTYFEPVNESRMRKLLYRAEHRE
jgi:hypothetical protein